MTKQEWAWLAFFLCIHRTKGEEYESRVAENDQGMDRIGT